jgi:hypothetical protein
MAKDYVDALRQDLDAEQSSKKTNDLESKTVSDMEQMAAANYRGAVMEQHKALSESVSKIRLESLKEYKSVFEGSLKQLLAEQEESGIDKFLAASAMVARGVNQAQRKSASTTPATEPMQSVAPGQQQQLTADQVKRVQTMLRSVTSVMGRLTPEQKKQFSSLLGRLKQAIG